MAEKKTEKLTKIKLFKDEGRYKDDVFVCVNGKPYAVKRGVEVEVPVSVAKVIEASEKQDGKTATLIQKEQDKFKEASKNI
ncbi:MAG: hypothetical protein IJD91_01305 [Clostridia bacterium]|nr:hypothetical protein [Clostridia bacterium]